MMEGLKVKYFVLSPESSDDAHAYASRAAITRYAYGINGTQPELARDLLHWMEALELQDPRDPK